MTMSKGEVERERRMLELVRLMSSVVVVPTQKKDIAKYAYVAKMGTSD